MPEKLQTLVLIFVGLLFLAVRWWKKAKDTMRREAQERRLPSPDQAKTRSGRPATPSLPATSFEELLKQMQKQNQQRPEPSPAPRPTAESSETTPAGRPLLREQARAPRSLERTDTRPVSLEAPATARSLEAAPRLPKRAATLPRAVTNRSQDYWNRQTTSTEPSRAETRRHVTDLLRSPADVRAAFVLSETLKRKYE